MSKIDDEVIALRGRLAEQTARAEKAEATASLLDAVVRAYPNATTDLAQWAKPTIALIGPGALQAISPIEVEDADGGTPWPGQCIGALINGFLDLASDVGKHNGDADRLVHNAVDELRKVARELRVAWADREMAIVALTKCGVALDVHSSSSLVSHAKSASRQVHDLLRERDRALAANVEMRAALEDWHGPPNPEHSVEHCPTCDLLSRPDLGAGMVVVPREMLERLCERLRRNLPMLGPRHGEWSDDSKEAADLLTDLDARLKKGGGT